MKTPLQDGRYVVFDIGTVTTRMLIADVRDQKLFTIDKEYTITNLGEDVDATGYLKDEAMDRVCETLDRYKAISEAYEGSSSVVAGTMAIATSAARDATNANEFRRRLRMRGVELAVIPGEREAALSFLGASQAFSDEIILVADIGGGSTEIIVGMGGESPLRAHSFNVGCRRVTEKFFQNDPPLDHEIHRAREWIRSEMEGFFAALADIELIPERVVAVAGTATSVVSIRDRMEIYDSERVHLSHVTLEQLHAITHQLATLELEKRKGVVGLDPGRASVIVAGLLILEEVLALAGANGYTVSEDDILQGMVIDCASRSLE